MGIPKSPCKDCPDRFAATKERPYSCHCVCEKYKAFKAEKDAANAAIHHHLHDPLREYSCEKHLRIEIEQRRKAR